MSSLTSEAELSMELFELMQHWVNGTSPRQPVRSSLQKRSSLLNIRSAQFACLAPLNNKQKSSCMWASRRTQILSC